MIDPPTTIYRKPEGDEPVTVVADPRALYGIHEEELTPVVEAKTAATAPARPSHVRLAILFVLLVGVGLAGYRAFARGAFAPKAAASARASAERTAREAKEKAARATAQASEQAQQAAEEPATEAEAARSFALGEYE